LSLKAKNISILDNPILKKLFFRLYLISKYL
jgi:hypothetical protein